MFARSHSLSGVAVWEHGPVAETNPGNTQMSTAQETTASRPPRRRQQEILEAAALVFREKGYESTSIQDIADAVGILKGSLYYYIRSKEDLLYEIIKTIHEDALRNVARIDEEEGDALQKIRAFVTAHMTFMTENLVKMGVFFHDFRSLSPERREEIIAARDIYDRQLRELIKQGKEEGVVREDVDPKLASLAAMGAMNWLYQWYRPGGRQSVKQIAGGFADLIVAGLARSPGTGAPHSK
jgi:TetR/AcrR family transcriptional regulator, cholesterol catabolism regulator